MNRRGFIKSVITLTVVATGWLPALAAGQARKIGKLWYLDDRNMPIHVGSILKIDWLPVSNQIGMGSNVLTVESRHGNFPPFLKEADFVVKSGNFAEASDWLGNTRRLTGCCVRILKTGKSGSHSAVRSIQVVVDLPAGAHASPLGDGSGNHACAQ